MGGSDRRGWQGAAGPREALDRRGWLWDGTLASLDQGTGAEAAIVAVVQIKSRIALIVPALRGTYNGELKDGQLTGTWSQGRATVPLVLKKTKSPNSRGSAMVKRVPEPDLCERREAGSIICLAASGEREGAEYAPPIARRSER